MRNELPLADDTTAIPAEQRGREKLRGAYQIELERLRPDPKQPRRRIDEAALQELAASIRRHGLIQPLSVRYVATDDVYQIISGQRRYEAAKLAGLDAISCLIHDPEQRDILVRQVVENWQRAELHPFEIADALGQLWETNGHSQKQLAEQTGKPEAEISKFLRLLELTPDVQRAARADPTGALSFRHLYNIARLEPAAQPAMVATVREQGLSAIETEDFVRNAIKRHTSGPKHGAPVTKVEYATAKAKVVLTFRKQTLEKADILAALDEARAKAQETKPELRIVRAK